MKNQVLACFMIAVCTSIAIAQRTASISGPSITTVGTAEVLVVPDIVTVALRVKKTNKDMALAKVETDESIKRIISVTKQYGVLPTDVKTDYVSIKEVYETVKKPESEILTSYLAGYSVSKTILVKLRELNKFDDFLSEIVKSGVTEVGNVEFETTQLRKYKDEARAKAIRAAREKAIAFAKEIGQTVGKAITIEERDVDRWNNPSSNYVSNSFSDAEDDKEDTVAAFSVGTISIKAQVEVKFVLN